MLSPGHVLGIREIFYFSLQDIPRSLCCRSAMMSAATSALTAIGFSLLAVNVLLAPKNQRRKAEQFVKRRFMPGGRCWQLSQQTRTHLPKKAASTLEKLRLCKRSMAEELVRPATVQGNRKGWYSPSDVKAGRTCDAGQAHACHF